MKKDYTKSTKNKKEEDCELSSNRVLKSFMVLLFMYIGGLNLSYATDYYINDNTIGEPGALCTAVGNDANPGTPASPKATLTSLRASLLPGDNVFVDLGTYNWGTAGYIGTSGGNGTAASHVKIIGVDSVNTKVTGLTANAAFLLDGSSFPKYWDFSKIKFSGGNGQNALQLTSNSTVSFMTFKDCVFEATTKAAIEAPAGPGATGAGLDNFSFTNCRIQSSGGVINLFSSGPGVTFTSFVGCTINHTGTNTTTVIAMPGGLVTNNTFDKCTINNVGTGNIFNMPGGQYNDWVISNCKIRGAGSGNALQLNGGSTYINFNVFNNFISKVAIGANIIGVANASGMSFQFNSFYTTGTCFNADGGQSGGTYVRNNIFYTTGAGAYCIKLLNSALPVTMDYNLYYAPNGKVGSNAGTDYAALSNWQNQFTSNSVAKSNDAHSVTGDPLYTNAATGDLSITCASPAFHKGVTVATITTDINNVTRANPGPSIGATEGGGQVGPITVTPSTSTVCAGTPVTLTASGGTTYSWSPATGLDVTTGATVIATPSETTTYTVTSGVGGCAATTTAVINVNPSPVITFTPANPVICGTGTAKITASGADSYTWTPATGLSATTGNEVTADITETTTYTVTGSNGCEASKDVTVTVASKPTVGVSAVDAEVCKGESTEITASGAVTYTWSPDLGLNQATGETVISTPTESITYDVIGTDANGCTNTASIDIIVNDLPVVAANSDATDDQVCKGSDVTLTGSGAESYTWDNGVTNGVAFAPASTETYTVTGTDVNGCVNTASIEITVNGLPDVTATSDATDDQVCKGSDVTLTGSGAESFTWDNGVTDGVAFAPTSTKTYTVTGTDANGCENNASIEITVNSLPEVTANADNVQLCKGGFVTLTGSGAESYTWDNGVTDGVAFSPEATNTYTVIGTDANGCQGTDEITVNVEVCSGITKASNTISLEVYPNPNNGKFTLQFDSKKSQVIEVIVYDSKGQIQYRGSENPSAGQVSKILDLNLTKGIYQIQLISDDVNSTQKFVVY